MVVTLTDVELAQALRIVVDDDPLESPIAAVVGRLLGASTAMVEEYLPEQDDKDLSYVHNEAAIRASGYLYNNAPSRNRRFADVLANSGALSILSPFRIQRALSVDGTNAVGPSRDTSGGVTVERVENLIAEALAAYDPGVGAPVLTATVAISNAQLKTWTPTTSKFCQHLGSGSTLK